MCVCVGERKKRGLVVREIEIEWVYCRKSLIERVRERERENGKIEVQRERESGCSREKSERENDIE